LRERLKEGRFGTFIGRYRAEYADEKQLQSDGNMPSLLEQETTRFRRGPMNRDFSVAASRAAAIDTVRYNVVRHKGKRLEADSARHKPSALRDVLAQNHGDPSAGLA
jgi:hypothetical protein